MKISAYENVVLLNVESFEDTEILAKKIGEEDTSVDDKLTIEDVPAQRMFSGVRKVQTISNYSGDQDRDPPGHRSEISYSEFRIKSLDDLMKLGSGKNVDLTYVE